MKFCVICGQPLSETADFSAPPVPETAAENSPYVPITEDEKTPYVPVSAAGTETISEIPSETDEIPVSDINDFNEYDEKAALTETVEIKQKPKIKMFRNIPAAAFSAVLGVCVFALILSGGVFAAARYITYPETIKGIVESTDILDLPIDVNVGTIVNSDASSVGDAVYTFAESTGLTRDDIDEIYENSSFREGIASIISGYADYIRDGILPPDISADDIKQLFTDNIEYLNDAYGFEMSPYDIEVAHNNIELAGGLITNLSLHTLQKQGVNFEIPRMLMSYPTFIAIAAVTLLIVLLIARINKKAAPAFAVTGISAFAAAAVISLAVFLFSNQLITLPATFSGIIGSTLSYIAPVVYIFSAAAALIGIIFFVTARVTARLR
jgi:hypothetical protein